MRLRPKRFWAKRFWPMRKERQRRRLSMTSLIDVIFLLLLFLMLSSTFTRFAEVDLATAGGGGGGASLAQPVFLTLSPDALRVNGADSTLADLPGAVSPHLIDAAPQSVLISLHGDVTAQGLTDVLAALHAMAGLRVTVLGQHETQRAP